MLVLCKKANLNCYFCAIYSREIYRSKKSLNFCIYLKRHLKSVKGWWDHHSVSEIKRQSWIDCYYKGAMLESGKISPSRANYWSYIGFSGSVEFRDWQMFKSLSQLMSWLLGCDYCLVGPQGCIYWTEFAPNSYFRSKDCHWLASV